MEDPVPISHLTYLITPLNTLFIGLDFSSIIILILIPVFLFFSAMISGSEIGFFSLTPKIIKDLQSRKDRQYDSVLKHIDHPKTLLASILIANNMVNIAVILLSTTFVQSTFDFSAYPWLGFLVQVVIITSMILFFGEILPKIYARQKPLLFATAMAGPLSMVMVVFKPLIFLLVSSTKLIDRRLTRHKSQLSLEDLSDVVDLAGELNPNKNDTEDQRILKGIATFGDTEVKEIMKARVDVKAIEKTANFQEVIQHIQEWGYSRIPVYDDTLDHISGVLYIKDLLPSLDEEALNWNEKIRHAFFVPENKKINDLLQEFRSKKIHLAIVVDEFGGTSGIVTLEDVLEEIVGDINDEFDQEDVDFNYIQTDDHTWIFEAKCSIHDFCKVIDVDDEIFDQLRGESDSLAGLLLEIKGDFPKPKEIFSFKNLQFEVLKMEKRRISRVRIHKNTT
jgi:gliding motility-associated protein GldE